MDIPLIGGDKIRSLIKNATKDSSTGSNESLMKTNTRDENNLIKDSNQLEMDKKNKIVIDNLNKGGPLTKKMAGVIEDKIKSGGNNVGGGINVSQGIKTTNPEIKNEGMNENLGVNVNNGNYNGIRLINDNGKIVNSGGRIYDDGKKWWQNESIGQSKEKSKALVDLYKVAGRLNEREEDLDIKQLRENFSEFEGLDDNVLSELVNDMRYMVENEDEDLLKIVEAYPELGKVRLEDLNNASKAELLGGLVDGNDEKWGLIDWLTWQPNLLTQAITGKTWTQWLGELGDWAYDSKKMIKYTDEADDEFIRNLQKKYSKYMNENGEWLEPGGEASKQFSKELDDYELKAGINNAGNMVLNFFKGLPKVLDTVLNIGNHPGELVKTLPRLLAGAPMTGTEWIADKVEEKTGNNFMDKLAQRKGYDTWQEIKEAMQDKAKNGKGPFYKVANWVFESSEVSDGFKEYIVDSYGSDEKFLQTLVERPEDVISDFVSVLEGGVGIAKGAGLIDATRAEMIIKNLGYLDMYEVGTKGVFQAEKWLAKNQLKLAEKSIGKTMKGTEKVGNLLKKSPVGKMVSFVENKLTGLSEEERKFIRENGDIVEEYLKGNRSADEIAEMIMSKFDDLIEGKKEVGKFYDIVRNNDKLLVKTSGIVDGIKGLLNELGIKIDRKGILKFGELSYTPAQQRQLQQVYGYVKALENLGDSATAKDVWRARQLIDSLANWEGNTKMGLDAEVMNSIRNMRGKIDDALKEQVKGFKEADTEYRELSKTVKELRKDWFTKEGNLKDNALSKIRNLTNKGNEAKLERLEKNFPGITRSLKGLGVSQSIEKASKMMVGQYAQQLLIGGGLWKLINGDLSVATALIGAGILTPKNLVKILKKEGNFMSKWRSVADNLSKGKVLSDEKLNRLRKWLRESNQEIIEKVNEEEGSKGWENVDLNKVDLEYDKAQKKAYVGGRSTEKVLSKEERASLLKKYAKGSENNGFVMKIVDSLGDDIHGMVDLDKKLVKLEENFGDTTVQHEFFHELFSVIDEDTKKYVINEVKNYLDLSDDVAAEEWLAESFGIYIRRKEIKLGNIRLKGNRLQRFQSKLRDLFQRAYEWIQDYSMDRKTINKLFNEVYGAVDGNVLDESGKFNLAEKLGINEKSPKLGVNGNGLRYKKAGKSQDFGYTTDVNKTRIENTNEGKTVSGEKSKSEKPISELGLGKKAHSVVGDGADGNSTVGAVRQSKSANGGQNFNDSGLFGGKKKNGINYIDLGNGKIITDDFNGKSKFSGKKVNLSKENKGYYYNLVRRINEWENGVNLDKNVLVGKTERGNNIILTRNRLGHIFEDHGAFYLENFIEAINSRENQFWAKDYVDGKGLKIKGKPRIEMKVPGSDEVFLVSLDRNSKNLEKKGSYIITSFRESKPSTLESDRVRLKRVYHGSAADFKKFDSSHMGEGEGAQAHGWGHYVAVDRNTAKGYAEMKGADFEYKGKKLDGRINYNEQSVEERVANQIYGELQNGKKWDEAIKNLKGYAEGWIRDYERKANNAESAEMRKYYRDSMKEEIDGLKMLDKMKEEDFVNKGGRNLYRLEIPDPVKRDTPTGSNYIEESKGVSETLYNKIHKLLGEKYPEIKDGYQQNLPYYNWRKTTGYGNWKELYEQISGILGGDKQASKFLESLGYDGIHYFGGIDGEAYVIFGDDSTKIKSHIRYKKDKLRPGEIDYGNKGLNYKGEISRGKVKEFLSKNMSKEELIRNIGRYDEAKKEFDVDLKKRAKELNGREVTTSIKMRNMDDSLREGGIKRIMEKQEKKGKIGGVRDIVRGTVIVEGKEGLKKALDKFYKEGQGVDDKYSFIGENDMGYRDLSFVYYTKNGIPCEVQVNVPEMMVAKDGKNLVDWGFISKKEYDDIVKKAGVEGGEGHKMYEKYRNLNEERKGLVKLIDKKGEKNMIKEIERIRDIDEEMDRIEKESREYYKKFEDLIK